MINSIPRLSGSSLVILVISIIAGALLWWLGPQWHLSVQQQILYWLVVTAIISAMMAGWRKYKQLAPISPETQSEKKRQQAPVTPAYITELRDYLYHRYGRFWRWKVRFVAVTGHSRIVEKTIPGLTEAQWLEANGVVAIWGGNVTSAADSGRITALRQLKRCAVNAIVLVYDAPLRQAMQGDTVARQLNERYKKLGWRVPFYLWEVQQSDWSQTERETQPVGCLLPPRCSPDELLQVLNNLPAQLSPQGVQQGLLDSRFDFLLRLAQQLRNGAAEQFKTLCQPLLAGPYAVPLRGVMFSLPVVAHEDVDKQRWLPDNAWQGIIDDLPSLRLQRVGLAWEKSLYQLVFIMLGLSCTGLLFSYSVNRHAIAESQQLAQTAGNTQQSLDKRLSALDALQSRIDQLQYRTQHGAPWYSRFGLSQNAPLLTAMWPEYARSALPLLRDAAAAHLHQQLAAWNSLPADSGQRSKLSKEIYNQLKAYLMLSQPGKMEATLFTATVMQSWPDRANISPGFWQYQGSKLLRFMAQNLPSHPQWQTQPDAQLIASTRSALLRVIGMRNAEASLYQKMLTQVSHNYADMRLNEMTADTDAGKLFVTDSVVPGMFTRQAWEDAVQPAIDKVVKERRDEIDWVLSDNKHPVTPDSSPDILKNRLTERYFTDYASAWLGFLNDLHWQKAATLSDAIDQLTMMADVRQSPLVALMNTLNTQGRAGQQQTRLTDSLVKSAQHLLNSEQSKAIDQNAGPHGPLDAAFGPLLNLMENKGDGNNSLSLQTFLTRVTRVRLKLQQVTNTADPQAMMQALAQTVFQGKSIDVTDTRDYGSLIAASLGQEWSGFGQAVFVQPMEQAWQQVLSPTAQSINTQWQNAIVNDWQHDFNDRYPFAANKQSETSLPLLSQYLRNDTGRIAQFVKSNLSGVLRKEGRHWVPDAIAAQGLHFNPDFINSLNQLSELSDVVFTSGDAGVRFQLMGKPSRDVMQTRFILDQQTLNYHNQLESWQTFSWPDSQWKPRTTLSWVSVNAGERLYADYPGSWGLIRLLDKAQVTMVDNSTYKLTWKAADNNTLNFMLRTDSGKGPLALLALKGFRLPQQVFIENKFIDNKFVDSKAGNDLARLDNGGPGVMEDLTLRYFDAEMRYLRDAAKEFATLHPEQAAMMGLSTPGAADESVEHLFQGFAFLMGRLREKLDDDFPELTEGLIGLLWPHYLRPVPSMSVVEIAPDIQGLKLSEIIEAHSEVASEPVGEQRLRCRYRTTQNLVLHPLQLTRAERFVEADGTHAIRLRFHCGSTADWQQLDLAHLPLYLNGDAPLASLLHLYLTRRTGQLFLRLPGDIDRQPFNGTFRATGFDADTPLWPVENNDYRGYQHLLEYFTFREKFMFVALEGLEHVNWPETLPWFELEIQLTQPWPSDFSFNEQHLRLHCVPVVNLFRLDAKPLQINSQQSDYLLRPLRNDNPYTEIFSVEQVATSFEDDAPQYTPFRHFQHQGGMLRRQRPARYYHTRLQRGPSGRNETLLILGGHEFERERQLPDESLALSLIGTNGTLPRQTLKTVLLDTLVANTQTVVTVQNLCPPTMPCYPPNRDRFHWKLLSQLGSSFLWMMDNAEVLRNTLALYDWTENTDNSRRLDAITDVKHHRLQYFKRGGLRRGVDIEVTVNSNGFAGEGDVWLFGSLLNRFFAQYADIHLFNQLTLIQQPSGQCLRWNENHNPRISG